MGKAESSVQSLDPTQLYKNGRRTLNTSLPRDKEPTQLVLSLQPTMRIVFPVSGSRSAPLFCLSVYVSGAQTRSQLSVLKTPQRRD